MSNTNIEWTDKVWNPTTGCTKVSAGCKNCYAERMHARLRGMKQKKYDHSFNMVCEHEDTLGIPFKWNNPQKVFVNSMSDLFHKNVSMEFIAKVYAVMYLNSWHTFQLLTKRPERRFRLFGSLYFIQLITESINVMTWPNAFSIDEIKRVFPFENIWEGISVENQHTFNDRMKFLYNTEAKHKFLSVEPLLSPIDMNEFNYHKDKVDIDWVIVGRETGPKKRPIDPYWAIHILNFCKREKIPFLMKSTEDLPLLPRELYIKEYPKNY